VPVGWAAGTVTAAASVAGAAGAGAAGLALVVRGLRAALVVGVLDLPRDRLPLWS
jgi:hypothetical protein